MKATNKNAMDSPLGQMMHTLEEEDVFSVVAKWRQEEEGLAALGNWIIFRDSTYAITVAYKKEVIGQGHCLGDGEIEWKAGVPVGVTRYGGQAVRNEIIGLRVEDAFIHMSIPCPSSDAKTGGLDQ